MIEQKKKYVMTAVSVLGKKIYFWRGNFDAAARCGHGFHTRPC